MRASSAPAMMRANFAHVASKKNMAITTMAAANKKRQKHNFILTSPSLENFPYPIKLKSLIQGLIFKTLLCETLNLEIFFHMIMIIFIGVIKEDHHD